MGLFRKVSKTPVLNSSSSELAVTTVMRESVKNVNGSSFKFVEKVKVPVETLEPLPTMDEFDYEEMLKNGYNPQQINVNGMLDDGTYNPNDDLAYLHQQVDNNSDVIQPPVQDAVDSNDNNE